LALTATAAVADGLPPVTPVPTGDSHFYYRIGGASPISNPAGTRQERVHLGGSATLRLGYSCGQFDPIASIRNQLNNAAQTIRGAITTQMQSAIAALPMYILQRADPGLYDLLSGTLIDAEKHVDIATKSCREMEREIARGDDPYADWVEAAKAQYWKLEQGLGRGGTDDVVAAQENVDSHALGHGITWPKVDSASTGRAGGLNQPAIHPVRDTSFVGFNLLLHRPIDDSTAVVQPAEPTPQLLRYWSRPLDAAHWVVNVTGDLIVSNCDGCAKGSQAGVGLLPDDHKMQQAVADKLTELIADGDDHTPRQLAPVSAPGVGMSDAVIHALRTLPDWERGMMIAKLADEIALARVTQKALLARRMLLTGEKQPDIAASGAAEREDDKAIADLERAMKNLSFEHDMRQAVASRTALSLLEHEQARRQTSRATATVPKPIQGRLKGGGISTQPPGTP
jgi:integrating conjugative element protein (TIGR03755 family)